MHRSKKKRNIIIFSLVGVLLCMVAGYAAFQTQLKVSGTSKVTSNWDIEITNVTPGTPTGSAENTVAPSFEKLWASMEANLYDKGDAMEYDVTIENKGTLDAKLNDIITNLDNSNNEAVIITFSGYTKGEVLKAKTSKVIHVKIEYNPEYEGGETSSEVEINFDYGQNNNEENNPDNQYLLTYDYSTNGGTSVELTEELIASGNNVDLSNTATKEGWNFVGWNTDKDAQIGLENYQMPASNTTLYAIYSKTLKVTYEKGDSVESIGKNEDSCNIYNNGTSCEITLPEITVTDDSATVGWYEGNNKVGEPNDKYTITNDITLRAEAQFEPIIQSWSSSSTTDFHNSTYRTNIITATFLDNKEVPEGATNWDVSSEKNGSVMAWVIPDETDSSKYHLYIGGDGGVIANKNSSYLFYKFTAVEEINFGENFDTSNVTTMTGMFSNGSAFSSSNNMKLTRLDLSSFDTKNVTNMQTMFFGQDALIEITFGDNFDTSNVKIMQGMFSGCNNLTALDVSNFKTYNVTNMSSMFSYCSGLTTLDVSNWDTSKVKDMSSMFYNCSNLTTLDVSKWTTSSVTNMNAMFSGCSKLITLDVGKWDTSNVTNMGSMFYGCSSLTTIDVSKWDTSSVTSMYQTFSGCSSLTTLDVSKWDTSNVTNMSSMFSSCSSLTTLDVSDFDTNNVTNMSYMFNGCSKLTTLDVGNFNTSKVTRMAGMFENCSNLKSIDVSDFDTNNVTSMDSMFMGCDQLITLDVSNFNTSNVTNMSQMFDRCNSLTTLDVSKWDTSKVTGMRSMFSDCSSITKLVLCNWNTSSVTNMISMFSRTSNLKSIYVGPNWTTANVDTLGMFVNSGVSSVTQSDNCEIDAEDMSLSISTTSTTNSITVVANAKADSGIARYEYSKDGGYSWTTSYYNTYTFNNLTKNTSYNIRVRVTSNNGKQMEQSTTVYTKNITTPTFRETETSSGKNVIITYPSGCGSSLTCTYQKDNGTVQYVYSTTANVSFTASGSVVARVSDGTNTVSSSYTVIVGPSTNIGKQPVEVVESGDGLYEDTYESGRYVYKGANPDNYIEFDNGEIWRIVAKEADGTYKILKNELLPEQAWDTSISNNWIRPATLNTYLNGEYYTNLDSSIKDNIVSHTWGIGAVTSDNADLAGQIASEQGTTWSGNIGLIAHSDYLRANSDMVNCGTGKTNYENYKTCRNTDWMYISGSYWWTISPYTGDFSNSVWIVAAAGTLGYYTVNASYHAPRPAVYLKSDITLSGSGTSLDPFKIVS